MELLLLKGNTYYIKNATNIGIYKINETDVYIIDSGNDSDAGKKIVKCLEQHGLQVKGIISTHSNADHIGGNKAIMNRTGAVLYTSKLEQCFVENPILEPSLLYGGYPMRALRNKFLLAKESSVTSNQIPDCFEVLSLKGHFFDMIGIKTKDNVYFLADSLFSEETILKYHIFFIYDVKEFLNTLDFLETLKGEFYVPSHVEVQTNLFPLIEKNRNKIKEIISVILEYCKKETTFEELLKYLFDYYDLTMNENQYVLVGSTIKSYLSYLCDEAKMSYRFFEHKMLFQTIS